MIGKELLEAAESFFLIAVGHHKGVRQSAESGNAEADSRTHVRCACAAADVRGARGQHTGLGPVGAATAKLDKIWRCFTSTQTLSLMGCAPIPAISLLPKPSGSTNAMNRARGVRQSFLTLV